MPRPWLVASLATCAGALIAGATGCAAQKPQVAAPAAAPSVAAVTPAPQAAGPGDQASPPPVAASTAGVAGSTSAVAVPATADQASIPGVQANTPAVAATATAAQASIPGVQANTPAVAATATAARVVLLADEAPVSARPHAAAADPAHAHAHEARAEARAERHHRDRDPDHTEHRPYHPAPGIVVDVVGVDAGGGGAASAAEIQRAARSASYWPFRQCYEEGLRRDQRLSGKVSLELDLSPAGSVDRATVTTTTVRDDLVGACVAREARRLALPGGDSPTTAKLDVTLVTGDEPVPAGRVVPNADLLLQALRGSWGGVRRCYTGALASHPDAGGRLELHFRVHRDGEIANVDEASDAHFADMEVTRCVLGVYRNAKLPALHSSRDRAFIYALELESKPGDAPAP